MADGMFIDRMLKQPVLTPARPNQGFRHHVGNLLYAYSRSDIERHFPHRNLRGPIDGRLRRHDGRSDVRRPEPHLGAAPHDGRAGRYSRVRELPRNEVHATGHGQYHHPVVWG